ncbi:MAG: ATP-binding cassette domain-containing protein, partial [Rhodocyclaceae bacterium]|nr:ATP-binding cassette domain-containing protein [Rhodocyclaceae bacterium]
VLGQDLSRLNSATRDGWRADHVGFIFQQFNLIPYLSVLANVTLPCRLSARRRIRGGGDVITTAQQLLQRVGLSETLWHKPAMLLSIGQQQRVAAARALIGQPELVIADEPTSALDAARQQDFLSLLAEVCSEAGATLVYVSHDARLAAEFDTVIALNDINKAAHV